MSARFITQSDHLLPPIKRLVQTACGTLAGLLAGLIYAALLTSQQISPMMNATDLPGDSLFHLLLSAIVGGWFGLTLGERTATVGGSLVWGINFGVLWWLVGPLTLFPLLNGVRPDWSVTTARTAFPLLVGLSVTYGAFMGLLHWGLYKLVVNRRNLRVVRQRLLHTVQASISGGLSGLLGGWIFGMWMEQTGFFPLVAGLVNSTDPGMGRSLHFGISVLIGVSYGILFQRDTRTIGTSIAWGLVYGLIWWILGSLTLMPLLLGQGVQWSLAAAQSVFASLIGHLLYGITLGVAQAVLNQIWRTLFVDSDPLMREPEGPGTRGLRALGLGAVASIGGGLAFTTVMVATNALPVIAGLMGMSGAIEGFIVHMGISVLIGAAYGLLFRHESTSSYAALAWGLVYGTVWWVLGPLTLMPSLLGSPLQWSLEAASSNFPSLVGHLLYGVVLAFVYDRLLQRYDPRRANAAQTEIAPFAKAVPALWVLTLILLLFIVLLQM